MIVVPVLRALAVYLMRRTAADTARWIALGTSLVDLVLALVVVASFRVGAPELQWVERTVWVPSLGIEYYLGVDGISLWMVALTAFLTPIAIGASWPWMEERAREY